MILPFDDNFEFRVQVNGMQGNEYRQIMAKDFPKFCTFVSESDVIMADLTKHSTLPDQSPDMCPIKAGYYEINDFALAQELPKHMFLGIKKWRLNWKIFRNNTFLYHCALYLIVN